MNLKKGLLFLFLLSLLNMAAWSDAVPLRQKPADIEKKVDHFLDQMTLEEKVDLLGGVDDFCLLGVPRLGIPRFCMSDGPLGVNREGPATVFPGGIALAATWNTPLAERVGTEIGREARAKGMSFLLAPAVNLYRLSIAGRNFEYYGEDPFLAARMAVGFIRGVQSQGVCATIKHFMGNNSEFDRNHTDSRIDERTMREIYLPPFEAAVKDARVGAVMASYNLVNGIHMSQNAALDIDILKREWGFDGILMSDWGSTYDGLAAARGGLDLEMPAGTYMNRDNLLPALKNGQLSVSIIDDKVRRILRTLMRFGQLDREASDLKIPRYNRQARETAWQTARESIVLLKNEGNLLPLDEKQVKSILVVGPNAYPAVMGGGGSSEVTPFGSISILEGMADYHETQATVFWDQGIASLKDMVAATHVRSDENGGAAGFGAEYFSNDRLEGKPVLARTEEHIDIGSRLRPNFPEGTQSERWTGYFCPRVAGTFDFFVGSFDCGSFRLLVDGKVVIDNWERLKAIVDFIPLRLEAGAHKIVLEHRFRSGWYSRLNFGISRQGERVTAAAKALAAKADAVVVAVGFNTETESESADRTFCLPPGQEELIMEMAKTNQNIIVVVNSGGGYATANWLDKVPVLIQAWYPGQEGGTALAEILFGAVNPSGRLPATFERRLEDNPAFASYYPETGSNKIHYREGVFAGYRDFQKHGIKPLFPFGFGLSYTTFTYANLVISPATTADGRVRVSFDVTNTGPRPGADVPQIYIADDHAKVARPMRELKGFTKIELQPGETRRVSIELDRRALSYFNATSKKWQVDPGSFAVMVGRSCEDILLRGTLKFSGGRLRF